MALALRRLPRLRLPRLNLAPVIRPVLCTVLELGALYCFATFVQSFDARFVPLVVGLGTAFYAWDLQRGRPEDKPS